MTDTINIKQVDYDALKETQDKTKEEMKEAEKAYLDLKKVSDKLEPYWLVKKEIAEKDEKAYTDAQTAVEKFTETKDN